MRGRQKQGRMSLKSFGAAEGRPRASRPDNVVASWRRCVKQHRLDPPGPAGPHPVIRGRPQQHRQQPRNCWRRRHGMEDLYRRVNAMGYVLLLSNARGVTVDAIGDAELDRDLRHAGLIAGSEWDERHVGTNGVGACLASGRAITVHRSDHFDVELTGPVLHRRADPRQHRQGLMGVLDLSHLQAPRTR